MKNEIKKLLKNYSYLISIFFTVMVILLFNFTKIQGLKLYPIVVNFLIFLTFFLSLFSEETIIQKFAKIAEKGILKEPVKIYTRKLTYIWCIFLFLQFLLSIITCFMSDEIWMIYNGCLSYVLLGCFFAIEYAIRIVVRKRNNW